MEPLAEPVEQRLTHAARSRPQAREVRHREAAAPVFSSDDPDFSFVRIHASMVAAPSWAARLKAGLARTRDVLNTPVSELFTSRRIDESLYEDLETALLQADCGVAATQSLMATVRKGKF